MKGKVIRFICAAVVALVVAMPGGAFASGQVKGCDIQGTWFGVNDLENKVPSGWVITNAGKSSDHGVNALEFPTFDATFGGMYAAIYHSANRGVWHRTGGNTFEYSFMSILAGDGVEGPEALYYVRVSGDVTLSDDCMAETITAIMDFYPAGMSPFTNDPLWSQRLADHYGYRFTLDGITHTFP